MITPSLETCKLLKEKGWTKETKFVWWKVDDEYEVWHSQNLHMCTLIAQAPTSEEIAKELPSVDFYGMGIKFALDTNTVLDNIFGINKWYINDFRELLISPHAQTAENMAKWWIWCADNGYEKSKEGL